jgi:hypothetical protein
MLHRIVAMLTRMAMKFDGVAEPVQRLMLTSITITSTAALSTRSRPKNCQNHGMQRSGGGELSRENIVNSRRR